MRAHEFALDEITRMPQGDFPGGKSALHRSEPQEPQHAKPLPGGSRFVYTVDRHNEIIDIYDPESNEPWQSRAQLVVSWANIPDIDNAVKVEHITVDEDYRGEGLARALYGIVLAVLKLPLVAGDSQTPGGRRMWQMLHNMPGVKVQGVMALTNSELDKTAVKELMHTPGIDFLSRGDYYTFLTFPVATGRRELKSLIKGIPLYHGEYDVDYVTFLLATWHGQ